MLYVREIFLLANSSEVIISCKKKLLFNRFSCISRVTKNNKLSKGAPKNGAEKIGKKG